MPSLMCKSMTNVNFPIEKFLIKSKEAFFDKVKEDKCKAVESLRFQCDLFYNNMNGPPDHKDCQGFCPIAKI